LQIGQPIQSTGDSYGIAQSPGDSLGINQTIDDLKRGINLLDKKGFPVDSKLIVDPGSACGFLKKSRLTILS